LVKINSTNASSPTTIGTKTVRHLRVTIYLAMRYGFEIVIEI